MVRLALQDRFSDKHNHLAAAKSNKAIVISIMQRGLLLLLGDGERIGGSEQGEEMFETAPKQHER